MHFLIVLIAILALIIEVFSDYSYQEACFAQSKSSGPLPVAPAPHWCEDTRFGCTAAHPLGSSGAPQSRLEVPRQDLSSHGYRQTALEMPGVLQDGQAIYATMCLVWQNMAGGDGLHVPTWHCQRSALHPCCYDMVSGWSWRCTEPQSHSQTQVQARQEEWRKQSKWRADARVCGSQYSVLSARELGAASGPGAIYARDDASTACSIPAAAYGATTAATGSTKDPWLRQTNSGCNR